MASSAFFRIALFIVAWGRAFPCHGRSAFAPTVRPVRGSRPIQRGERPRCGPRAAPRRCAPSPLFAAPDADDVEPEDNDAPAEDDAMSAADLERQKGTLESMLQSSGEGSEASPNAKLPVLTTARKQRFEREIELLQRLDPDHPTNDNELSDLQNQELVISELWSLWYGERGPANMMKLRAIEDNLADPSLWPEAEQQYTALIREHCGDEGDAVQLSNWVEPANRLATLLFLMGRLGESKQWCERILREKPWHVGALQGVVMVCMKMGDVDGARRYSAVGLPNATPPMRDERRAWVQRNVGSARMRLARLEVATRAAYGEPDDSPAEGARLAEEPAADDEAAWQ